MTRFTIPNYIAAHQQLSKKLDVESFAKGIEMIKAAFECGKKILTCGNGGSASTASHYITDWNKMVNLATGKKFRGVSLCDNVGLITAYGNDLEYADVFSGQIEALMDEDAAAPMFIGSALAKGQQWRVGDWCDVLPWTPHAV